MKRSILWLVLSACGPKAPPAEPATPAPVLSAAEQVAERANAQVPPALRDILQFQVQSSGREFGAFDAIVPAGWPHDKATSTYAPHPDQLPPHNNRLGYSSIRAHTTCAGNCAPKDWTALIESKVLAYADKGYTIEQDTTPTAGHRQVVAKHPDKRIYAYFFSQPDGNRYFVCEAEVDGLLSAATEAFQTACSGMVIHNWK